MQVASFLIPDDWIPEGLDPSIELDYHHLPLPQQFNHFQIRSIELDLWNDPEGGLFANRLGNALVGEPIESGIPVLDQPGIKIMHFMHFDYMTNYLTFKQALEATYLWSENHPDHYPFFIQLELKDEDIPPSLLEFVHPFTEATRITVVNEILDVIPEEKLITPVELRSHATLYESIQANGWPTLAECRGKLFFITLNGNGIGDVVFGSNGNLSNNAEHIFKILDDPIDEYNDIQQAVASGLFVRVRADVGSHEARTGETERREMAFASGAQIITTDFYKPDPRHLICPQNWSDYNVQWPGGNTARSNVDFDCYLEW